MAMRQCGFQLFLRSFALALLVGTSGCGDGSGDTRTYTVELTANGGASFGALQFELTHLGNSGEFLGREDKVDCVPRVDAITAGNYVDERVVRIGMISLAGIPVPSLILSCGFRTREDLKAEDFLIEVTDASDTQSEPLDPAPTVVISDIYLR